MKQRIAGLQAQISQFDQTLTDSKAVLRNFQDNIRLRKERASLTAIDNEIDQLDEDSARKAYRKFETEYNEQRRRQSELQAEVGLLPSPVYNPTLMSLPLIQQAKLGGEIETLKKDHEDKQEELNSEYKDIDEKYRRELINVKVSFLSLPHRMFRGITDRNLFAPQTAEMSNQDLEKLQKALDG